LIEGGSPPEFRFALCKQADLGFGLEQKGTERSRVRFSELRRSGDEW